MDVDVFVDALQRDPFLFCVILLTVLILISQVVMYRLLKLLVKNEREFCESLSLRDSWRDNSPNANQALFMLVTFGKGRDRLSDSDVLRLLRKAQVSCWSVNTTFLGYLYVVFSAHYF